MSYKRREYDEDPVFSGQALRPSLAYDNYLMYNNSVVSGHSIRDKFSAIGSHHSLYRLKGSNSGSFGSGSSRSGGCRRCIIISAVLLSLGVLGAVIGVVVFFSDQSPTMKTTTAVPPTTTTPSEKLLVVLRDGRTLIGYFRSIDQFANLVLHRTIERIHVGKKYGDKPRGIFVVRGENVVLLGEIDLENENNPQLEEVPIDDILEMQREEQIQKQQEEERKKRSMLERGLQPHSELHDDLF